MEKSLKGVKIKNQLEKMEGFITLMIKIKRN